MGALCSDAKLNEVDELLIKPDLTFDNFTSSKDKKFFYESVMKVIGALPISDFLQIIYSLDSDDTSPHSYNHMVNIDFIPVALKNKLLKHPLVVENSSISERDMSDFISFISKYLEFSNKNYKSFMKAHAGEKAKSGFIPKVSLFPLTFLYSSSTENRTKISLMFNLFSENGVFKESNDLFTFVYFLLACPTNILLLAINEVAKEDSSLRSKLPEEDFLELYRMFEVKDSIAIAKLFTDELFNSGRSIQFNEFEDIILSKKLFWIFSPSGVRKRFEKYNETANES